MADDEFCLEIQNFMSLQDIEKVGKRESKKEEASKSQKLLG